MEKIALIKSGNVQRIEISAAISKTKLNLLLAWLILWTLCGTVVFSQFFTAVSRETKLMMVVWFVFWTYFEYKVAFIYGWRKNGKEVIQVSGSKLSLQRSITGKEKTDTYELDNLSGLEVADINTFTKSMGSSFWVTGAETVSFKNLGRRIGCGLQLDEKEARQLYKMLKPYIKAS
jgi:hypothetical protein